MTAALPPAELALTALFVNTTCSSKHMNNDTAVAFVRDNIVLANRFEAAPRAAALIIMFFMMAHASSLPTPKEVKGTMLFYGWVLCVSIQATFTSLSVAAYIMALAAFVRQHDACLTFWQPNMSFLGVTAVATVGFQPRMLVYLSLFQLYGLQLVEAARAWCVVRRDTDIGSFWVAQSGHAFRHYLRVASYATTMMSAVLVGVSLAWVFAGAYLPIFAATCVALRVMWRALVLLKEATVGKDRGMLPRVVQSALVWLSWENLEESGLIYFPFYDAFRCLAASPLVAWGVLLALRVYAGAGGARALIAESYHAAFEGVRSGDFAVPLLKMPDPSRVVYKPSMSLPPGQLMASAEAMLTLGGVVGLLKVLISLVAEALACCNLGSPNLPMSKLAGDESWGDNGMNGLRKRATLTSADVSEPQENVPARGGVVRDADDVGNPMYAHAEGALHVAERSSQPVKLI